MWPYVCVLSVLLPIELCTYVLHQPVHFLPDYQDARKLQLERMGEEILDLWQQLDIGKDEQV